MLDELIFLQEVFWEKTHIFVWPNELTGLLCSHPIEFQLDLVEEYSFSGSGKYCVKSVRIQSFYAVKALSCSNWLPQHKTSQKVSLTCVYQGAHQNSFKKGIFGVKIHNGSFIGCYTFFLLAAIFLSLTFRLQIYLFKVKGCLGVAQQFTKCFFMKFVLNIGSLQLAYSLRMKQRK